MSGILVTVRGPVVSLSPALPSSAFLQLVCPENSLGQLRAGTIPDALINHFSQDCPIFVTVLLVDAVRLLAPPLSALLAKQH